MSREALCEVMAIIEKASPIVASLIDTPKAPMIIGLLALLVNCKPNQLSDKIKNDHDLYAKLSNLESTHGEWLKLL